MKKLKEGIFFFKPNLDESRSIPLTNNSISAGFPSPADDFKEIRISLDKEIVRNEEATFYARVDGDSMQGAGLSDGDLIVIDRSEEPKNGSIAVCFLDGEFTVKRLKLKNQEVYLMPENSRYSPIKIDEGSELSIWGVVTYVVKKMI